MTDLIKAFFERELSESEANELGKLLENSPEAPLRFKELSRQRYLAMGLPDPQLPEGIHIPSIPKGLGLGGWIAGAVLLVLGGAAVLWKFWPSVPVEVPVKSLPAQLSLSSITKTASNIIKTKSVIPSSIQPVPALQDQEGVALSVTVETQTKVLLTVRVINGSGNEVRNLFAGFVQPGQWAFKWDGILSDGQKAPAGEYKIDVQTGASHQFKTILIQ
jgi:hypothetical protein